jgi:hypothetical protein
MVFSELTPLQKIIKIRGFKFGRDLSGRRRFLSPSEGGDIILMPLMND